MKVVFLGSGGGRFNLVRQFRGTGGFFIDAGKKILVDPGPGCLLRAIKLGLPIEKTDFLLVSHNHVDHASDANVIIEAMAGKSRRGVLLASKNALHTSESSDASISRYHQSKAAECRALSPSDVFQSGGVRVQATPTRHGEESGVGFLIEADGKKIGYTGDTAFFPELPGLFKGCDLLIVCNLRPYGDAFPGHLCCDETINMLKEAKPTKAVLTHLGVKFLKKGVAASEAQRVTRESGVETIAAKDEMAVELGEEAEGREGGEKKGDSKLPKFM